MSTIAIDLSLRSTALVYINESEVAYKLVTSDSKKINDEELILYNTNEICKFIDLYKPNTIAIEGLSFNSVSSSKDLIAGNFWYLRTHLFKHYKDINIDIVPVLTWRSPLFNKEERVELKLNTSKVKELKKYLMKATKEDKKFILTENEILILKSNIKYLTWEKVPEPLRSEFHKVGFTKGCFDLSDAYQICKFVEDKYGKI